MLLFIYSLILAAVFGFLFVLVYEDFLKRKNRRDTHPIQNESESRGIIDTLFYPVFSRWEYLFKKIKLTQHRSFIQKKIIQADINLKFNEEKFWSFQIFMMFVFILLYFLLCGYLRLLKFDVNYSFQYAMVAAITGFLFPYYWIFSIIKKRTKQLIQKFPDFVSNLALSVEAGLDFFASMIRYVESSDKSILKTEINKVIADVRLGSNREVALKDLSNRVDIQPIRNFVAVLIQATQLGTSVSKVLRIQADKLRRERFELAERAGAMASQKILFPLIFFIMPAVFILIFGPIIVKLLTGGLDSLFL